MKTTEILFGGLAAALSLPLFSSCSSSCGNPTDAVAECQKDLPFEMSRVERPVIANSTYCITDFGGVGDGMADNTAAFACAMREVSALGGGRIVVPGGVWLTGPITFESGIDLHLTEGAVVLFSDDYDAYPIIETTFEGLDTRRCMSPLNADGKTNIAITGQGTFDGNGGAWRWVKKGKLTGAQWKELQARGGCTNEKGDVWFPTEAVRAAYERADMNVVRGLQTDEEWAAVRDYLRPVLLSFRRCKNVLLEGVCFKNSPAWNLHPYRCENIIINDVFVVNPWYSQNGDGLDLECCKNAVIVNSRFDVGDDAICVKSGKDEDGRRWGIPCENVVVRGCAVYHGHGGFVVGSEMSGGVKNVSVRDCMFLGTDVGLRFKSTRGRGGVVENIYIDNINMIDIPTDCLLFDLYYSGKSASEVLAEGGAEPAAEVIPAVTEETPCFRNIFISRVNCRGARRAMYFNGLPEMPLTNVNVSDSHIKAKLGVEINESDGVTLTDTRLDVAEGYALTAHNVRNLIVSGVEHEGTPRGVKVDGTRTDAVSIVSTSIARAENDIPVSSAQVSIVADSYQAKSN